MIRRNTARYTLCFSLDDGAGAAVISWVMSCGPPQKRPFASQEMLYIVGSKHTRGRRAVLDFSCSGVINDKHVDHLGLSFTGAHFLIMSS